MANPMAYNGGAIIAMTGKECVAIASDLRFGIQAQTVGTNFPKVFFKMHDKLFLGLSGLVSDIQTMHQKLVYRLNLYRLREEREIKPKVFSALVSSMLYEKRFGPYFVEPVIAGLDDKMQPFIASQDIIGCPLVTKDFVVTGTAPASLLGMCESLYRPDLGPDDIFETISQSLLSAVDRDALAGWGGIVHIITKDKVITKTLKGRCD